MQLASFDTTPLPLPPPTSNNSNKCQFTGFVVVVWYYLEMFKKNCDNKLHWASHFHTILLTFPYLKGLISKRCLRSVLLYFSFMDSTGQFSHHQLWFYHHWQKQWYFLGFTSVQVSVCWHDKHSYDLRCSRTSVCGGGGEGGNYHWCYWISKLFCLAPQWGAADTEIKVSSGENTELKHSPFKAWSRSVYSHTCYTYCQGSLPCLFLPFWSIHLLFFPKPLLISPVLAVAYT